MAEIFAQDYLASGNPVSIVTHFLSVYTKGEVSDVPPSCKEYREKNYDIRRAYVAQPLRGKWKVRERERDMLIVTPATRH